MSLCDKCGADHNGRCKGHRTRRDDDGNLVPCKRWAKRGLSVCTNHGGGTKQSKAAAARNLAHQATFTSAMRFGVPRHVDPAEGLIAEYWLSAGLVDFYQARVTEIEREHGHRGMVFGVVEESQEVDTAQSTVDLDGTRIPEITTKTVRRAQPHVWLNLLNAERDRFTKLGIEITRLGLEARRDEYIRLHVSAFIRVLDGLELSPDQRARAGVLLRELDTAHSGGRVIDSDGNDLGRAG